MLGGHLLTQLVRARPGTPWPMAGWSVGLRTLGSGAQRLSVRWLDSGPCFASHWLCELGQVGHFSDFLACQVETASPVLELRVCG